MVMSLVQLSVMYGHLEGTEGKFARDPSGYLSIEAGIYQKHRLEVSWNHVQGTEERYRRLEDGTAQISLVVGRASLQHFLDSKTTRILGCAMNRCPYYLIASPAIRQLSDFKGKTMICREGPSRNTPIAETFRERARLSLGKDLNFQLSKSDLEAFNRLVSGNVQAALLPRPYGFWAEERGFKRISDWPDVVDDPLPISIETTATLLRKRGKDFSIFLQAHREGIRYLKAHRAETLRMLQGKFGDSPTFAGKTFDDYLIFMDEELTVDFKQVEKLLSQVAPDTPGGARQVASEWIMPGSLKQ
jgi:ABC-type nitrate/sulfonate/bicarbonate transport system substrate-binding protein